jgi:hypothetical protein
MPTSIITRPIGPTYLLSATTAQSTIGVRAVPGEPMNYAEFINTNTTSSVCVTIAPLPRGTADPITPALVFPNATSAPTSPPSFMLGPAMQHPRAIPVPANGFSVSAIVAAGTSTVFITPVSVM